MYVKHRAPQPVTRVPPRACSLARIVAGANKYMTEDFSALYPRYARLLVPLDVDAADSPIENSIEAIDAGMCTFALLGGLEISAAERGSLAMGNTITFESAGAVAGDAARAQWYCDTKSVLPETLMTLAIAFPVSAEWEGAISWAILEIAALCFPNPFNLL